MSDSAVRATSDPGVSTAIALRKRPAPAAHAHGHHAEHGIGHGRARARPCGMGTGMGTGTGTGTDMGTGMGTGHGASAPEEGRFGRGALVGLGVAGGLVPSPTALLVLLGAIGLGRTWFGVGLVLSYGVGMAATLTAAGLLLVGLRDRLDRVRIVRPVAPPHRPPGRGHPGADRAARARRRPRAGRAQPGRGRLNHEPVGSDRTHGFRRGSTRPDRS